MPTLPPEAHPQKAQAAGQDSGVLDLPDKALTDELDEAVAEVNIYQRSGAKRMDTQSVRLTPSKTDATSTQDRPQKAQSPHARRTQNFQGAPKQGGLQRHMITRPGIYIIRIGIFLTLCALFAYILGKTITTAFLANPGLNGLILGVLALGTISMVNQILKLFPEVHFINTLRMPDGGTRKFRARPKLLAPLSAQIKARGGRIELAPQTLRTILDSVAIRLDEGRELNRYLVGLLVFLGLLGTFWGLIATVGSISDVIRTLQTNGDTSAQFDELKNGLSQPLAGMSIAFTSSLFGLAGSLVLGFLDLQVGQAQNRFYTELEDALASEGELSVLPAAPSMEAGMPPELAKVLEYLRTMAHFDEAGKTQESLYIIAASLQGLVEQMRHEQQLIRDWVDAQAIQQQEFGRLLARITELAEQTQ